MVDVNHSFKLNVLYLGVTVLLPGDFNHEIYITNICNKVLYIVRAVFYFKFVAEMI